MLYTNAGETQVLMTLIHWSSSLTMLVAMRAPQANDTKYRCFDTAVWINFIITAKLVTKRFNVLWNHWLTLSGRFQSWAITWSRPNSRTKWSHYSDDWLQQVTRHLSVSDCLVLVYFLSSFLSEFLGISFCLSVGQNVQLSVFVHP
jgi:hypothetical protein